MTWADQIERRLRSQDDYYHDVGLFHGMLRFQIATALVDLRRNGVLRTRRERYRGVHNGKQRQLSRMIYTVRSRHDDSGGDTLLGIGDPLRDHWSRTIPLLLLRSRRDDD